MRKITFDAEKHIYYIDGNKTPSVTQILGVVYGTGLEGAPAEFVNRRAGIGHEVHAEIDAYLKNGEEGKTPLFQNWKKLLGNLNGESEGKIFAETKYGNFAGTIDFFNGFVWDWKTSKTATPKQLKKWQMQLSFYCYALRQNGKVVNEPLKIGHITTDGCDVINLEYLGDDFVIETMKKYADIMDGKEYAFAEKPQEKYELETISQNDIVTLENTLVTMENLQKIVDDYKEKIKAEMEKRGILSVEIGRVKISYVSASKRQTLDSKSLKSEEPEVYAKYLKTTEVKPSIRLSVK